jgi:hypothetical protein
LGVGLGLGVGVGVGVGLALVVELLQRVAVGVAERGAHHDGHPPGRLHNQVTWASTYLALYIRMGTHVVGSAESGRLKSKRPEPPLDACVS